MDYVQFAQNRVELSSLTERESGLLYLLSIVHVYNRFAICVVLFSLRFNRSSADQTF